MTKPAELFQTEPDMPTLAMRGTHWMNIALALVVVGIIALVRWMTGWPG